MKNIKEITQKIINNFDIKVFLFYMAVVVFICASWFFSSHEDSEEADTIYELETQIENLRYENEELKAEIDDLNNKIDAIHDLATSRMYDYSQLLDDIENETY